MVNKGAWNKFLSASISFPLAFRIPLILLNDVVEIYSPYV